MSEKDLETALRKAFVDNRAKSILMDGHEARSPFKRDAFNYGIDQGLLRKHEDIEDSPYTAMTYVLTDKGKKSFGLDN